MLASPLTLGLIALGLGIQAIPPDLLARNARRLSNWPAPATALLTAGLILAVDALRPAGVAPFIYFQF